MNKITLKRLADHPSLGVGVDLPWETSPGFRRGEDHDHVDVALATFLDRHAREFGHFFFAFQPRDRNHLDATVYLSAYDALMEHFAPGCNLAFHHTMLNVCGEARYERRHLLRFTNDLVRRYGIKWVNEDIGIWSLGGKSLPYPLAPMLNKHSLSRAKDVVKEIQDTLLCPFVLEFPGFTDGSSLLIGDMDAFDYFRELATGTDAWVNLDTGHILSYQFLCARLNRPVPTWERLPLDRCFEIHLAGSQVAGNNFRDMHDGRILPEQFELLRFLLKSCPELCAVTFEDPRILPSGDFEGESAANWERLSDTLNAFRQRSLA
jgi:uncharacterized protein (UPF0276 family)